MNPLIWAARHGPYVLIAGLAVGLFVTPLAHALRPWIPQLVVALLFVSVLRMEPRDILGSLSGLSRGVIAVLALQLALPLLVLGGAWITGTLHNPLVLALMLMTAAPSIVGSPNICVMMGVPPAFAMRLMVMGTALLPVTVVPVFWAAPSLGDVGTVLGAATRLLIVIVLTTACAALVRRLLLPCPSPHALRQLEGASAIALAVFVIGLMPAVTDVARDDPLRALGWLGFALAVNFGAQMIVYRLTRNRVSADMAVPLSIIAGNRNVALFFVSLAPEVIAPALVFIGCYQIPMYLTPLVMTRVYRNKNAA